MRRRKAGNNPQWSGQQVSPPEPEIWPKVEMEGSSCRWEVEVTLHVSEDFGEKWDARGDLMQRDSQADDLLNLFDCPNECLEETAGPSSTYGFAA